MAARQTLAVEIIKLCDELGDDDEDRLSHLHDALATVRERLSISSAKADGGTTGECWIAKHFGLNWEREKKTGADATDSKDRDCEIKASLHPLKTKLKTHKTNICYRTPERNSGEDDDVFVLRAQARICRDDGGHFWGTWFEKKPADAADRVVLKWWIPSVPLAQLIGRKMRMSRKMREGKSIAINFGARVCLACGGIHRIDNIVRVLGGWNGRTDSMESLAAKRDADHAGISEDTLNGLVAGTCASQCT